jgi:hypothetical protein
MAVSWEGRPDPPNLIAPKVLDEILHRPRASLYAAFQPKTSVRFEPRGWSYKVCTLPIAPLDEQTMP